MRLVALDLSLTATGWAATSGEIGTIKVPLPERASDLQRVRRLHELTCEIDRLCVGAQLVVIEGHSFNSKNTHAHSLGELHGVVKAVLYQREIPFAIVPPAKLKLYACGKGNASKDQVLMAAARKTSKTFPDHNSTDAWWLLNMALSRYEQPMRIVMPIRNEEALRGVDWPPLGEERGT